MYTGWLQWVQKGITLIRITVSWGYFQTCHEEQILLQLSHKKCSERGRNFRPAHHRWDEPSTSQFPSRQARVSSSQPEKKFWVPKPCLMMKESRQLSPPRGQAETALTKRSTLHLSEPSRLGASEGRKDWTARGKRQSFGQSQMRHLPL